MNNKGDPPNITQDDDISETKSKSKDQDPGWEESASAWYRFNLNWLLPMLQNARKGQQLQGHNISPLPQWHRSPLVHNEFSKMWHEKDDTKPKQSLCRILTKLYAGNFVFSGLLLLTSEFASIFTPIILMYLFKEMETKRRASVGLLLCLIIFGLQTLAVICNNLFYRRIQQLGLHIRTSLISEIASKCLTIDTILSNTESGNVNQNIKGDSGRLKGGKVSILLTRDAYAVEWMLPNLHLWWSIPLICIVVSFMLWEIFDWMGLLGCWLLVAFMPLLLGLVRWMNSLRKRVSHVSDERLDRLQEVMHGLRTIKFHVWEQYFEDDLESKRDAELRLLWYLQLIRQGANAITIALPVVCTLLTLCLYVFVGRHRLYAAQAVIGLTLFNMVRQPIALTPIAMNATSEGLAGIRRIEDFLRAPDVIDNEHLKDNDKSLAVRMEDVVASHISKDKDDEKDEWHLRIPRLLIPHGQLVIIYGPNGLGKSSLLRSLLGFLHLSFNPSDTPIIPKTTSYAPQTPWIMKRSIRENITFYDEPPDQDRYQRVLDVCQLVEDLKRFPQGDRTIVDESNLSGGQCQRIGLARALYDHSNVCLLDDPVSALDKQVAEKVIQRAIIHDLTCYSSSPHLAYKRTRIVVTQHPRLIEAADQIFTIDDQQGELVPVPKSQISSIVEELQSPECITPEPLPISERAESETLSENIVGESVINVTEDEYRGRGSIQGGLLLEFIHMGGGWSIFATGLAFMTLQQTFRTLFDFYANVWARSTGLQNNNEFYAALLGAFALAQTFTFFMASYFIVLLTNKAARRIHQYSLKGILQAPFTLINSLNLGAIVNRFSFDQDVVDYALSESVRIVAYVLINLFGVLAVMVTASGWYFIPVSIFSIGLFYFLSYYRYSSRELARLSCQTRAPLAAHLSRTLQGQQVIRAFGKQSAVMQESYQLLDWQNRPSYSLILLPRWLELRVSLLGNVVILCAAMGYFYTSISLSNRSVSSQALQAVSLVKALTVSRILFWLMRRLTDTELQMISVERILHYAKLPKEEEVTILKEKEEGNDEEEQKLIVSRGHVQFRDVTVRYPPNVSKDGKEQILKENETALSEINLDFVPGSHSVIMGRTGSGKSTLLLALFRLVPVEEGGSIIIDDVDVRSYRLHQLRRQLAIVPQEPFVFKGTLRDNLDPLNLYEDHQLWHVLDIVNLRTLVKSLSGGLEWSGCLLLSVGQQQLLCLGRALLGERQILLLDEATSSLDERTARLMQEIIAKHTSYRTVIAIAHRKESVYYEVVDQIIRLDKGRVVVPARLNVEDGGFIVPDSKDLSEPDARGESPKMPQI